MPALNPGNSSCTSGLSKRIYDFWRLDPDAGLIDLTAPANASAAKSVRALCYAVARAVVAELNDAGYYGESD